MNRHKYLAELAGLLSFLSEEDRNTVVSHFTRRFDEAGESGESALMQELGSPMALAIALNREGIESIIEAEAKAASKKEMPFEDPMEISMPDMTHAEEPAAEAEEPAKNEEETFTAEETEAPPENSGATAAEEVMAEEILEENAEPLDEEASQDQPAEGQDQPAEGQDQPAEEQDQPAEGQDQPAEEQDQPAEGQDQPAEEQKPEVSAAELISEVMRDGTEEAHQESFPELSVAIGKPLQKPEPEPEIKLSVLGAIFFGILLIIPGVPLLALSIILIPVLIAPSVTAGVVGFYGIGAGMASLAYVPDAMLVFGAALIVLGLGLLCLVLGVWLIVRIIAAWRLGIPALYRSLVQRGTAK